MPRVNVPVVEITRLGVAGTEVTGDPANDHEVVHSTRMFIRARNADAGAAHDVVFVTPQLVDSLAVADRTVSIPLSSTRYIGPFTTAYVTGDGKVQIDVDSAQIFLTAFRLP